MNTGLLIAGGAAALLFLKGGLPSGSLALPGSAPAGYTPTGAGLYRGPDGRTYAKNPSTGVMVAAPAGTSPTDADDLLMRVGVSLIPTVGGAIAQATPGIVDWLGGLFSGQESATTPNLVSQPEVLDPGYVDPWVTPEQPVAYDDPWAGEWWDQPYAAEPVYYEPEPYVGDEWASNDFFGYFGLGRHGTRRRTYRGLAGRRYAGIY